MSYFDVSYSTPTPPFAELLGKTLLSINRASDDSRLEFMCADGSAYVLFHHDDCCESVSIESIVGDLDDLLNSPILHAEEAEGETPSDYKFQHQPDSYTWTFYKLATVKGWVDIRWLGESNGYYSESVTFARIIDATPQLPAPQIKKD